MICPLCQHEFDEENYACENCLMSNDCRIVCCPNCRYQFPVDSKLINLIKKILKTDKDA